MTAHAQTHYVGDVRAVNLEFLDRYQFKSLDGKFENDASHFGLFKHNGKIYLGPTMPLLDQVTALS